MKISKVKTSFKICDVVIENENIVFKYLDKIYDENGNLLSNTILTENVARVYLLVVDDEIYKIGGSQSDGGIKSTFIFYQNSNTGRPGISRYGIRTLIYNALQEGHIVSCYMSYMPNFQAKIKGLYGWTKINDASLSFKFLEKSFLEDYKKKEGKYPPWNFQENHEPWDYDIQIGHSKMLEESGLKHKKKENTHPGIFKKIMKFGKK